MLGGGSGSACRCRVSSVKDSQGQILALVFRFKHTKHSKLFPVGGLSGPVRNKPVEGDGGARVRGRWTEEGNARAMGVRCVR